MAYSTIDKVREILQGFDIMDVPDALITSGITCADAVIDAKLSKCKTVPFADPAPVLACCMSADYAAGWVLTRPLFAACSNQAPENGRAMIKDVMEMLKSICDDDLDMLVQGAEIEVPEFGVLTSTTCADRERIKDFPMYRPPVGDQRPIIHPTYGPRRGNDSTLSSPARNNEGEFWQG